MSQNFCHCNAPVSSGATIDSNYHVTGTIWPRFLARHSLLPSVTYIIQVAAEVAVVHDAAYDFWVDSDMHCVVPSVRIVKISSVQHQINVSFLFALQGFAQLSLLELHPGATATTIAAIAQLQIAAFLQPKCDGAQGTGNISEQVKLW